MTGLFLGAGVSFEAGMPLVWDLTGEIRAWLTEAKLRSLNVGWRSQGGGYPDEVIDALATSLNNPLMHYESILGMLETGYRRFGKHQQEFHGMYSWLVDLVWFLLYTRHVKQAINVLAGLRYLDGIVGLAEANHPLWIFSLNHDVIIEALAAEYQVPLSCGFVGKDALPLRDKSGTLTGSLNVETLGEKDLEAGRLKFFSHGTKGINLLKMHGALDVFAYNNGKDVLRVVSEPKNAVDVLGSLMQTFEGLNYIHRPTGRLAKLTNEIAYEDECGEMRLLRKSLLAGAFKFDPNVDQTLPKIYLPLFKASLNWVSELVCIGYGFGDDHVNATMRTWLEFSDNRTLVIVSPNAGAVPSPFLHLAGQVRVIDATATHFLEQYSLRPLSGDEAKMREALAGLRQDLKASRGYA
jgi:hypothetical protein